MKTTHTLWRFALVSALCVLLGGCLLRPVTGTARRFVLAPLAAPASPANRTNQVPLGIRPVSMPPYLQRTALAVRRGTDEIHYLQDALWAEPLDQSFQRTLGANLSRLLPTDQVYLSGWEPGQVRVQVSVAIEQFDVDSRGQGKLIAWWRLTHAGKEKPIKSGQANLVHAATSPRGNPQAVVATLNKLTAQFSQELADAIRESTAEQP